MEGIYKTGYIVKYEEDEYTITKAWNHGGNMVYYDLEAVKGVLNYKRIQLSVHHSEVKPTN